MEENWYLKLGNQVGGTHTLVSGFQLVCILNVSMFNCKLSVDLCWD